MRLYNKKFAFTLAEVLITLGIIGVVAAITIPALVANYEQMVLKNRFKRAYATFSNAYEYVKQKDFDNRQPECYHYSTNYNKTECVEFWKSMDKTLNIIKICNGNSIVNKCMPQYNSLAEIKKERNPNLTQEEAEQSGSYNYADWGTRDGLNNVTARILNDGTIYFLYEPNWPIFAIDVNGFKGPNKWGYDVFSFWFLEDSNKLESYGDISEK